MVMGWFALLKEPEAKEPKFKRPMFFLSAFFLIVLIVRQQQQDKTPQYP
jgi:hypothetical protein